MSEQQTEKDWKPRAPRPCPDCGRMGSCADCCCAAPDHRRALPLRPDKCSLCGHVTSELSVEVVAAQAGVNRALWRVRHVDSGATVYCRDRQEAEAHVHESASGPWVAEQVSTPVERCQTCIHPEGYDRLSGPCPTCGGDGVFPPATTASSHAPENDPFGPESGDR